MLGWGRQTWVAAEMGGEQADLPSPSINRGTHLIEALLDQFL
jgi:hypothetical protein